MDPSLLLRRQPSMYKKGRWLNMPKEMSIVLKNVSIKGSAKDNKGSFSLVSSGDIKITADPDTISAMAKYIEEVLADED